MRIPSCDLPGDAVALSVSDRFSVAISDGPGCGCGSTRPAATGIVNIFTAMRVVLRMVLMVVGLRFPRTVVANRCHQMSRLCRNISPVPGRLKLLDFPEWSGGFYAMQAIHRTDT